MTPREDPAVAADRVSWLRDLRRGNEEQESAFAEVFDTYWGEIAETHRAFVERFCTMLPPDGRVLDAACGTGKYVGIVLKSGRSVLGVDHTAAYLDKAREKFPRVTTQKHDLQELPYADEFDGVMCVDAMEFIPPEDWPVVLERFRAALLPGGWLYLTVELHPEDEVRAAYEKARRSGLPVVEGEVIWHEPSPAGDYYHHLPSVERVRAWIAGAGFTVVEELEGPWHEDRYAYHHLLARLETPPG